MRGRGFAESVVEQAGLAWLEAAGWAVLHGPDIAPEALTSERIDYGQVILAERLLGELGRLNDGLPQEALDEAFQRLVHPDGSTLEERNRAFHLKLVDGVTVEYRSAEGDIRGAQVRVVNFDDPEDNDLVAVNQFTVDENKHIRRPDIVLFVNGLPLGIIELRTPLTRMQPYGRPISRFRRTRPRFLVVHIQ